MKPHNLLNLIISMSVGLSFVAEVSAKSTKAPKSSKPAKTFEGADADHSGGLTVFEFATLEGPGTPLAEIRKRFLPIDISGAFEIVIDPATGVQAVDPVTGEPVFGAAIPDGLISKDEFTAYLALEEKPKSDLSRFELADFDGDGLLTPVELGYLESPKAAFKSVMRKFDKLDINDDGFISPDEFKKTKSDL